MNIKTAVLLAWSGSKTNKCLSKFGVKISCFSNIDKNSLLSNLEGMIISCLSILEWLADKQLDFHLEKMTISCLSKFGRVGKNSLLFNLEGMIISCLFSLEWLTDKQLSLHLEGISIVEG